MGLPGARMAISLACRRFQMSSARLLAGPNIAHIATLLPDGSPHSVAVWAGVDGDRAYFFTQDGSRKARNIADDPRVAISIVAHDNPYATAWLRGRVVQTLHGEEALVKIDELALKYTGSRSRCAPGRCS